MNEKLCLDSVKALVESIEAAVTSLQAIEDEVRLPTPDSISNVRLLIEESKRKLLTPLLNIEGILREHF